MPQIGDTFQCGFDNRQGPGRLIGQWEILAYEAGVHKIRFNASGAIRYVVIQEESWGRQMCWLVEYNLRAKKRKGDYVEYYANHDEVLDTFKAICEELNEEGDEVCEITVRSPIVNGLPYKGHWYFTRTNNNWGFNGHWVMKEPPPPPKPLTRFERVLR